MGCDIHIGLEQKGRDGKWFKIHINHELLPNDRDYDLFGFLFGVRNRHATYVPLFANRGIPKDTSFSDWLEYVPNECYHSTTYLTLKEAQNIEWPESLDDTYFKVFCEFIFPRLKGTIDDKENMRMVIYFDN